MAIGVRQQQRRATESVWNTSEYVLAAGEIGFATDTNTIKIGDGVNIWSEIEPLFVGEFLPLLGKAADSELLDGISADGFAKMADVTNAATANKIPIRDADGQMKAAAGAAGDDVVNLDQMNAADLVASYETASRTVADATTAETLVAGDVGKILFISNSSLTVQRTINIPLNAMTAIAVGSWIDICNTGAGNLKIASGGGITLNGTPNVFGNYSIVRLVKTATDTWLTIHRSNKNDVRRPMIRVYKSSGGTSYPADTHKAVPFNTVSSNTAETFNPSDEWFSIPAAGLATGRRVIVNKDGLYWCHVNWNGAIQNQSWIKVYTLTADNVLGTELSVGPTFWNGSASWIGRLTAGQSLGSVFYTQTTHNDEADGLSGSRNDMVIVRLGD